MQLPTFETPRLLVRPLMMDDFPGFFELQANPNVHRFTFSPAEDEITARKNLENFIRLYASPNNDYWILGIEKKAGGAFVGTCAVKPGSCEITGEETEIGYRILEREWGRGYASELIDPLVGHALGKMGLPSVFAQVEVSNVASVKILDRSQMDFVAEYFNEKERCTDRVYQKTANLAA